MARTHTMDSSSSIWPMKLRVMWKYIEKRPVGKGKAKNTTHTHTHTHTHTQTQANTTHTHTHTEEDTDTHATIHRRTHTHTHTHTLTHKETRIHRGHNVRCTCFHLHTQYGPPTQRSGNSSVFGSVMCH